MATDKTQSMCSSFYVHQHKKHNFYFFCASYYKPKKQYNWISKLKDAQMPPDNAKCHFFVYHIWHKM